MRTNFRPAMDRPWSYRVKVGTSWDPDFSAYNAIAGLTDPTQIAALNDFYVGLKADLIYDKLWDFLPLVGGTAFSHSVYGINPSRTKVTWVGSPTHNSNGVKGNGSSQYGNLNWNPVSVGVDVSNFGLGVYIGGTEVTGTTRSYLGNNNNGSSITGIGFYNAGSQNGAYLAGKGSPLERVPQPAPSPLFATGFHFIKTKGTRSAVYFRADVNLGSYIQTSTLYNNNIYILGTNTSNNPAEYTNATIIKFVVMTKGLSDTEAGYLNNRITTLQTALGRA